MENSGKAYINNLSIDCVIFGFHNNKLKVLLLKLKNNAGYSLPGGFIRIDETIEEAARKELKNRTGLENIFLRQFYVFSDLDRAENNPVIQILRDRKVYDESSLKYFDKRFITIGFFALVEYTKVVPVPDIISESCEWMNLDDDIPIMLDHRKIIKMAHVALKKQINNSPIGINLLPDKFTLPELQRLYETILGTKLDRRNFQRRIHAYNILHKLNEKRRGGAHKSPYLYKFNKKRYQFALENGLMNNW